MAENEWTLEFKSLIGSWSDEIERPPSTLVSKLRDPFAGTVNSPSMSHDAAALLNDALRPSEERTNRARVAPPRAGEFCDLRPTRSHERRSRLQRNSRPRANAHRVSRG